MRSRYFKVNVLVFILYIMCLTARSLLKIHNDIVCFKLGCFCTFDKLKNGAYYSLYKYEYILWQSVSIYSTQSVTYCSRLVTINNFRPTGGYVPANTRHSSNVVQCLASVADGGLTLYQHWVNVLCLLGYIVDWL